MFLIAVPIAEVLEVATMVGYVTALGIAVGNGLLPVSDDSQLMDPRGLLISLGLEVRPRMTP